MRERGAPRGAAAQSRTGRRAQALTRPRAESPWSGRSRARRSAARGGSSPYPREPLIPGPHRGATALRRAALEPRRVPARALARPPLGLPPRQSFPDSSRATAPPFSDRRVAPRWVHGRYQRADDESYRGHGRGTPRAPPRLRPVHLVPPERRLAKPRCSTDRLGSPMARARTGATMFLVVGKCSAYCMADPPARATPPATRRLPTPAG